MKVRNCKAVITKEKAVSNPCDFDISDYFGQIFSMFSGEACFASLLCDITPP